MLKRFQIWLYLKRLEFRYKKEGKWIINEDYLLAICNGFNCKWLNKIDRAKLVELELQVYFTSLNNLMNSLDEMNNFINKDQIINSPTNRYLSYTDYKSIADYFVDADRKPIDFVSFEIKLKSKIERLVTELKRCKDRSEIQYGYYKRCTEKIQSDILEIYWILLQLAK